jgi:hypothetical protein
MKANRRIDQIIEASIPAIQNGQESLESILDMYPHYAHALRPRLEAILWLKNTRKVLDPRPGFIASSRRSIEQKFIEIQPHGFWQRLFRYRTPQRWVFNFSAPVILVFLLILIVNSLRLSAQLSIPGDPLYTTKLILEDIQLGLTFNQVDKTKLNIELSRERTTEFVELVLEGDYELLPYAAIRMEAEMIASLQAIRDIAPDDQAVERSLTAELRETLSNEIFMLNTLKSTSPASAHAGINLAIQDAQSGLMALR